jgi:hypothetical protein
MSGYDRLFPDLPPLSGGGKQLSGMGRRGGLCDLGAEVIDSEDSRVDAVWPFFGQFVAHDITADRSPLDPESPPDEITNFRTPRANLECLYGTGPSGAPYMYEKDDPAKLLIARSGLDVARNPEGVALIADARNDSHLFISQLHLAFARLHNRFVDRLRRAGAAENELFDRARRSTVWHYQHVILREFLPQTIGSSLTTELIDGGPTFFDMTRADGPRIPLEFAAAAYRYGHAQIRQRYQVNAQFGPVPIFPELVGFGHVRPEHAVDWTLLIGPTAQKAKRIDMLLSRALIELPAKLSGACPEDEYSSLAARDLARGRMVGLASGEAIARKMGTTPLDAGAVGLAALGWQHETPLWLYILREAEVLCNGDRLGPVGGRIVGEVLVGIIDSDQSSFRALQPDWQPELTLADVLLRTSGAARITQRSGAGRRADSGDKRVVANRSFRSACPVAHGSIPQASATQ